MLDNGLKDHSRSGMNATVEEADSLISLVDRFLSCSEPALRICACDALLGRAQAKTAVAQGLVGLVSEAETKQ